MRRRDFIKSIAGSAVAWPHAAHAQQAQAVRRIGVLMNLSESDPESQSRMAAIRDGLRKLGWIEGRNLQVETRWGAGDPQRIRGYATELVAMKPEVIFASAATVAVALQRETRTVPIDRKSTRLNSSHRSLSRMPSSA